MDGFCNVDVNCDVNTNPKPDYPLDLAVDPWPWEEESVERIESYHFIEHVTQAQGRTILGNCFRALKHGGEIVIECPDLNGACESFLEGGAWKAQRFYGNQRHPWQYHRWGYTQGSMSALLTKIGFKVTHAGEGQDYHQDEEPCLRVEAVKP